MPATNAGPAPQTVVPAAASVEPPLSSAVLLAGRSTLVLDHLGVHYILRATRNGKLILTK